MNLTQLFVVWRCRWRVIAAAVLFLVIATLIVCLALPKKYTASAALLVDTRGGDALSGNSDRQTPTQGLIATQADLVMSERVARAVVRSLNLAADPESHRTWLEETEGRGDETSYVAKNLLRKLEVKPNRDSNIINISYTGADAELSSRIANAFAQLTVATALELKVEPARQFSSWFDDRTVGLRRNLEAAQAKLSQFQRERGIIATGSQGQIDIETAKLSQLTQQLLYIQATRTETNSRQLQASNSAKTSPDVMNSPSIAELRVDIGKNEAYLNQLRTALGEKNPQVIAARDQLDTLKAQLESEMRSVAMTLTAGNEVNQRRESDLRAAAAAQRERVLALSKNSNELAVLQRDLENAQHALDQAAGLQAQTALESQIQQTNVYFLTSATEPPVPSSPKIRISVAVAAALGLLIGMGLALWLESKAPIVRSVDDLAVALDLPVIGAVSTARLQNTPTRRFGLLLAKAS